MLYSFYFLASYPMAANVIDRQRAEAIVRENPGQVVITKNSNGRDYDVTVIPKPANKNDKRSSTSGQAVGGPDVIYQYNGKEKGELDDLMEELIPTPNEATAREGKEEADEDAEGTDAAKEKQEEEDEAARKAAGQ